MGPLFGEWGKNHPMGFGAKRHTYRNEVIFLYIHVARAENHCPGQKNYPWEGGDAFFLLLKK